MKRRVLIIHPSMEGGGAERVLLTMLENFDRNRYEITLVLLYGEGVFLKQIPADVEVKWLYKTAKGLFHRLVTHWYGIRNYFRDRRMRHLLDGRSFDVAVSFMEGGAAKLHLSFLDIAPRNVTWVHINMQKSRWYSFWIRHNDAERFYRSVDAIAFVSDEAREAFNSLYDTNVFQMVVYNPVDEDAIVRKAGSVNPVRDRRFKIVNVGRLVDQKRQDRLVRAAKILKDKGLEFEIEIMGVGPLESQLKALVEGLGVSDCVRFAGFIENPFPRVKASDVFCLTSHTEGFGMVVVEALALGVPVISTRVTGVKEILANGGGIFTGESPEEIAAVLESVIRHPEQLYALRSQAPKAVEPYRPEQIMKQVYRILDGES